MATLHHALAAAALLAAASSASCAAPDAPPGGDRPGGKVDDPGPVTTACPRFLRPVVPGRLERAGAREISGLAASRRNRGVLWAHNDDDGPVELIAFDRAGRHIASYDLDVDALDAEDLALGPGPEPGTEYLYVADIGDNARERRSVAVIRVAEPAVASGDGEERSLAGAERIELVYGNGRAHNAEALLVDPDRGDILILTKSSPGDPETLAFSAAPPFGETTTLELVGDDRRATGLAGQVVAADVSAAGDRIIVAFKDDAYRLWHRPGGPLHESLIAEPCPAPRAPGQQEAIAFAPDGAGFYLVPEGKDPDVFFVAEERACPRYGPARRTGAVNHDDAREISGLARSRAIEDRLWAINDPGPGERTRLLALTSAGKVRAVLDVPGAENENWEDLALGPTRLGRDAIYIADTGDNDLDRGHVVVYRVLEPEAGATTIPDEDVDAFKIEFGDDDPHDVESLAIDPLRGDLVLVTRRRGDDDHTQVFVASGFADEPDDVTVEQVLDEDDAPALGETVVAADVAADGLLVALGVRDGAPLVWWRHPDAPLWEGFAHPACPGEIAPGKHDSLAIGRDGASYALIPEGDDPPVFAVDTR